MSKKTLSDLYEVISERYYSMSKEELKSIIHELIYYTMEETNERQAQTISDNVHDVLINDYKMEV
jgi:hypothetical protein